MIQQDYLGIGLRDPLLLQNGEGVTITGAGLIEQSIGRILGEQVGERFFGYDFGSRIDEILFEPNDEVLIDLLQMFVFEAVARWEKRVKIDTVNIVQDGAKIYAEVTVLILGSNEITTYVYPWYRKLMD